MGSLLDLTEIQATKTKTRKVLFPSSHEAPYNFWSLKSFLAVIFAKISKGAAKFSRKSTLKMLAKLAILILEKEIRTQSKNFSQICILFPTSCPLAIFFIENSMLHNRRNLMFKKIKTYARLTNTSENRGAFSIIAGKETLSSLLAADSPNNFGVVRLGFETDKYLSRMQTSTSNKFRSPFPPIGAVKPKMEESKNLAFSFLGYPKDIKGVNKIVEIIQGVEQLACKSSLKWIVHVSSKNDKLHSNLIHLNNVQFLLGKISNEEMESALVESSVLVLPYDVQKYLMNASAMAYRAADYRKPVITLKGSAFSEEILHYGLGWVVDDDEEIMELISRLSHEEVESRKLSIESYNERRTLDNLEFLELDAK